MKISHLKIALIILFISATFLANAQYNRPFGARQAGMGNSGVTLSDIWSSYHNQAGLAGLEGISAGASFSNAFNIKELGTKSFATGMPVSKIGSFGINYTYFGYELYNESKFGLAYAMALGKRISAGVQIDYFLTRMYGEYGKKGIAVGEIGIIAEPFDNFKAGVHLFNPWMAKMADYQDERVPTILRIGLGYNFSEKIVLTIEGEKDIEQAAVFRSGIEYILIENLFLRAGVSTNPTQFSFGLGYNYIGIQLDISFTNHQQLGYTTQFGLSYVFIKKTIDKTAY